MRCECTIKTKLFYLSGVKLPLNYAGSFNSVNNVSNQMQVRRQKLSAVLNDTIFNI